MSERETQRAEAAKMIGQLADLISPSGPPKAINWMAILEMIMQLLPIILAFLAEDTDKT
jgi:hypothetical protein